jgi:hypothetical protein
MARGQKFGGRAKGTPNKVTAEIRGIAQRYGLEAVTMLAHLMRTAEDAKVKVVAVNSLLDRAYGKPAQMLLGDAEQPVEHNHNFADEFTRRIMAMAGRVGADA